MQLTIIKHSSFKASVERCAFTFVKQTLRNTNCIFLLNLLEWYFFSLRCGTWRAWSTFLMDLFQCSTFFLALVISFSSIKTSKGKLACTPLFYLSFFRELVMIYLMVKTNTGSPNVIDARGQSISRGVHNGVAFANFKAHKFSYLNITSIGTDFVPNGKECGVACVNIPSCFSFNLAAFYDVNGRILCELLPSDKYNNSDKFVSSQSFHHFSIAVSALMSTSLKR